MDREREDVPKEILTPQEQLPISGLYIIKGIGNNWRDVEDFLLPDVTPSHGGSVQGVVTKFINKNSMI